MRAFLQLSEAGSRWLENHPIVVDPKWEFKMSDVGCGGWSHTDVIENPEDFLGITSKI